MRDTIITVVLMGAICAVWLWQKPAREVAKMQAGIAHALFEPEAGDVYAVGHSGRTEGLSGSQNGVAVLWKNGEQHRLSDGRFDSAANSVFVSNDDVYVAGYEKSIEYKIPASFSIFWKNAIIWKNGVKQSLGDGKHASEANSVFIWGDDVYVAGYEEISIDTTLSRPGQPYFEPIATIWKNGNVLYRLTNSANAPSKAMSVFVDGKDIYSAGSVPQYFGGSIATVWKNDQILYSRTRVNQTSGVNSLFVSEKNIFGRRNVYYVGNGMESDSGRSAGSEAMVWKNGKLLYVLTDGKKIGIAGSVFVAGDDLYVAGKDVNYAMLWKNGEPIRLSDGGASGSANSVFVSGKDVYVGGNDSNTAMVWKNGTVFQRLSSGVVNSVFVK
ncbi:MAG: hypothetical protein FWG02_06885 [Holophagaceae bacterium]|nr:hypothetical protein [Holophagaceae bacterium]